jgi:hypothetical protein
MDSFNKTNAFVSANRQKSVPNLSERLLNTVGFGRRIARQAGIGALQYLQKAYCRPLKTTHFICYALIHQRFGHKAEYWADNELDE